MKKILLVLSLIGFAFRTWSVDVEWLTDLPAAVEKAHRENKYVLVDFTGSDWCPWCVKLKQEVFDQPAFQVFAEQNLVLVEIDFPKHKPQSRELQETNAMWAQKLDVPGFPTVVLLNGTGKAVARTGYMDGGPKNFLATLSKFPGMRPVLVAASDNIQPPRETPAPAAAKPAEAKVAPAVAPPRYTQLALRGVSGVKGHRMALINSAPLLEGEKASVKINGVYAVIVCKQIRDDSVSITVDGRPMELVLDAH